LQQEIKDVLIVYILILMKQVLLVDDLAIVRYGTTHLLHEQFPGTQVSTAGNVNEMVTHLDRAIFDLVILDIDFAPGNILEILGNIRQKQPGTRVLIFSGYIEITHAQRYVAAGAHGFLLKSESERKLKDAINTIFKGNIYMSEGLKDHR
jgi:two-component system, NarL family, invasion response regulator UvrY